MPNPDAKHAYEDFARRMKAIDEEYYWESIPPIVQALQSGLEHLEKRYGLSSNEYLTVVALIQELK